jgi:serine/threonine-protein kinase
MQPPETDLGALPLSVALRVDQVCNRYEAAWRDGLRPRVEDFLGDWPEPERSALVRQLVPLEVENRRRRGQACAPDEYRARFPALDPAWLADLLTAAAPTVRAPLAGGSPGAAAAPPPPEGRYRPLRFHAKGGLGEVYVALDAELHREVALKRIQAPQAHESENRQRFLREAEITARLEHPGVVPVYGLVQGADGQPCYAMRFIQGETLADAIRRFHEADKPGRDPGERRLALRELLGRFVAVCNTMAYAHNKGVIHRDLKPANIMLGPYGETLVVDWGLAKVFSPDEAARAAGGPPALPDPAAGDGGTQIGRVAGTPAYMSPEQAEGRWDLVGPAADVYSLGATLYALLTGQAPFEGPAGEVLLRVHRGDFPAPRQRKHDVPRALEAVCLKAMALRPGDRYATALALAADLEHWLADEPVAAYRPPWTDTARRWMRRHRMWVASGAAALVAALMFLTVVVVVIDRARRQSLAEQARTERQRQRARSNLERALRAVDGMLTRVGQERLAHVPGFDEDRGLILRDALTLCQGLLDENSTEPEIRLETGLAYRRMGDINKLLGRTEEAETAYKQSLKVLGDLVRDYGDDPRYREEWAASHNDLGNFFYDTPGRGEEARGPYERGLELRAELVRRYPDVREYRQGLAKMHSSLGGWWHAHGKDRKQAEDHYLEALKLRTDLVAGRPDDPAYQFDLAVSRHNLGFLYEDELSVKTTNSTTQAQAEKAEEAYGEAQQIYKQLVQKHPRDLTYQEFLAKLYGNRGRLYGKTRRRFEAHQANEEALRRYETLARKHPAVPQYQEGVAEYTRVVGVWHYGQALHLPRAKDAWAVLGLMRLDGQPWNALASVAAAKAVTQAQAEKAEKAYQEARRIYEKLVQDHPGNLDYQEKLADLHDYLGALYANTKRPDEAQKAFEGALRRYETLARKNPAVVKYQQRVAVFALNVGRWHAQDRDRPRVEAALNWYNKAVRTLEALPQQGEGRAALRQPLDELRQGRALALARLGEHAKAVAEADALARGKDVTSDTLYELACACAVASASVTPREGGPSQAGPGRLADDYARRAVELLGRAVRGGFRNLGHMRQDPDLAALHGRADFNRLLEDLRQRLQREARPKAP